LLDRFFRYWFSRDMS